jgi:hypothetical protein
MDMKKKEEKVNQEKLKKSKERGSFYYHDENSKIRCFYSLCMGSARSPTPINQSYSSYANVELISYKEWVKKSGVGRTMWEQRGYYASGGKVFMDPRSPKVWAIQVNQHT